ncbi:hypothetical protein RG47T_0368 [Mucilaginibacter polytrichastri]|uniref:Uncharacterized protein n=2 Tax=Mucilaginibacter polytrichastri TaxID=1302689 RepID=A0A1Q5ZT30_9SPHI|nr:hypothetical protein RG47T_0368 [Mucilaginibacter polytrichastri]SFS47461.1 hypothetical protein SAMN04487890_101706 [Mucilaginibacter polytrichastri]
MLVLAGSANAQVGGMPRELTCTEEAFNFKVSIKSGWHFGQVSMGPSGLPKNTPDYLTVRSFNEKLPQTHLPDNNLSTTPLQRKIIPLMPNNLMLPSFNKLNYIFPYNSKFAQLINYNNSKLLFQAGLK